MTASPWTLEEWIALPEDTSCRFELEDGTILVGPNSGLRHQVVATRLMVALQRQLPEPWEVLPAVEVVTRAAAPPCVRVPDLAVVSGELVDSAPDRLSAEDVLIAIEVVEPGTRDADTGRKRWEYAEAGIGHYWVVDPVSARFLAPAATGEFVTDVPFPIKLDLTDLTSRRERTERMMNR